MQSFKAISQFDLLPNNSTQLRSPNPNLTTNLFNHVNHINKLEKMSTDSTWDSGLL